LLGKGGLELENKIKRAALELFAKQGYERTTMRQIGNEVGIRGSSIYSHFNSKEEIFLNIIEDLFKKMTWEEAVLESENEDFDLKALLYKIFRSYYLFFAENKLELLFWQRIRFFSPSGMEGKYDVNKMQYEKSVVEVYRDLFKKGIQNKQLKDQDVEMQVVSFLVFISGYTDLLVLYQGKLSEKQLEQGFNFFWDGIKYVK
jgi:AcrR family transcriptional regulator